MGKDYTLLNDSFKDLYQLSVDLFYKRIIWINSGVFSKWELQHNLKKEKMYKLYKTITAGPFSSEILSLHFNTRKH